MTELRNRMIADMKLHGLAPGTQKVYVNAVSRLAGYFHRSPDQLSEQEPHEYFTYLVETKKVPSSTFRTDLRRQGLVRQDAAAALADAQVSPRPAEFQAADRAGPSRSAESAGLDSLPHGTDLRAAHV
jgi:hypothetical protein